jgi:hypothetical protein
MSTALRDSGAARPGNSKYFWTPVLVIALGCAGVALVELTDYLNQKEQFIQDANDLTVRAMGSRSDALKVAEERLEAGRIGFSLYRNLLKNALSQQDPDEHVAALESMDKLFASGLAFAKDLRKDLASWPTQVLITTTEAGGSVGSNIEKELKIRGIPVVLQKTGDQKGISKTEVFCYEQNACKQTAQSVIDVLQEKGYPVAKATTPADGVDSAESTQNDDAAKLLKKKRIEIVLANEEKSVPNKQVLASARHTQPHVIHEKQVVALTSQPTK